MKSDDTKVELSINHFRKVFKKTKKKTKMNKNFMSDIGKIAFYFAIQSVIY